MGAWLGDVRELDKLDRLRLGRLAPDEGTQDGDRCRDDRHGRLGCAKDFEVDRRCWELLALFRGQERGD